MDTRHRIPWLGSALVGLTLLLAACGDATEPASGETVLAKTETDLILQGHRGARGLKPESTLPSFELALDELMTTL
ncbi:MAG: hypothetical protein OEY55_16090, partial [Acidimicrobiia bacterium]|nr:hypothetical protein [Acidimicrobiia bacterium]